MEQNTLQWQQWHPHHNQISKIGRIHTSKNTRFQEELSQEPPYLDKEVNVVA